MVAGCVQTYVTAGEVEFPVVLPMRNPGMREMTVREEPYTVMEILEQLFDISIEKELANYVEKNQGVIRDHSRFSDHDPLRLKPKSSKVFRTEAELGQTLFHTEVDLYVKADIIGCIQAKNGQYIETSSRILFFVRYILDMWPCHRTCTGPLICVRDKVPDHRERAKNRLLINEFFLPVLYTKNYDLASKLILRRYWPEILEKPMAVDGRELARRMELEIRFVSLPKDSTVMGRVFFDITDYTIMENGKPKNIKVMPSTILINQELCKTETDINTTIIHECCHMVLDTPFFFLQKMTGSCSCAKYMCRDKTRRKQKGMRNNLTPIDWMELQAEKLPAYILMPEATVRQTVDSWIEHCYNGDRSPDTMAQIILGLVRDFHVSKAMAKYRLVELGYSEAEGVMNYINGKYVRDHGCSGSWPAGAIYTIPFNDATLLYGSDLGFTRAIDSGQYIYVDGHFCLKDRKYVRLGRNNTYYMTEHARHNIDECCIAFKASGRNGHSQYEFGLAGREKITPVEDRYNSRYCFAAEPGTEASQDEIRAFIRDAELWGSLEASLPADFAAAMRIILETKRVTQSELALRFGIDRKGIYELLNNPQPSMAHIVGACVALDIPYNISEKLLTLAGWALRNTPLHNQYKLMLMNTATLTVEMCNEILKTKKLPPLFQPAA